MGSEGSQTRILRHPPASIAFLRTCSILLCSRKTIHESSKIMLGMIWMLLAYGFNFRTRAVFTCTAGSVITIQVKQYARTRKTSLRGEYKIGPEFLAAVTLKV